jgi:hypothetical protein
LCIRIGHKNGREQSQQTENPEHIDLSFKMNGIYW